MKKFIFRIRPAKPVNPPRLADFEDIDDYMKTKAKMIAVGRMVNSDVLTDLLTTRKIPFVINLTSGNVVAECSSEVAKDIADSVSNVESFHEFN